MNIFLLSQSTIKEIDKLCMCFLWDNNGTRNKFYLTSWTNVCLPKEQGGLGFGEGAKWNKTMIAKKWRMQLVKVNFVSTSYKRVFVMAVKDSLLIRDHRSQILHIDIKLCPVCCSTDESLAHLLFSCLTNSTNTTSPVDPANSADPNEQPLTPRVDPPRAPRTEGEIGPRIGELAIGEHYVDLGEDIELAMLRKVVGQVSQIEEPRVVGYDAFSQ
uniref:Reverse transcriptase zinc-binding domain-containing protein n=1 Tax=Cannabis sativa TaxID=3483 RepID=A0A803Q1P6_CANSA